MSPRWRVWPCAGGWHPVFRHAPASGLGACPCAAASARHVAMCAAIAARPVRVAVGWTGRRAEWIALDETAKGKGASLVGRGPLLRGRMILEHWVRARASDASSSSDSVQAAKREIARIGVAYSLNVECHSPGSGEPAFHDSACSRIVSSAASRNVGTPPPRGSTPWPMARVFSSLAALRRRPLRAALHHGFKQRSRNCVRRVPLPRAAQRAAQRLAQVRRRHPLGYAVAGANRPFTSLAG